jgi:hypothetical protein
MSALVKVLARTSVGTGISYEMNNIAGYRRLIFLFEELSLNNTNNIVFQFGVPGPTFRTSGYIGFGGVTGSATADAGRAQVAAAANIVKAWIIEVINPDDVGEKTYYNSMVYLDITTDRLEQQAGRYDTTAEVHTCFRIVSTGGVHAFDGGFATVLGEP